MSYIAPCLLYWWLNSSYIIAIIFLASLNPSHTLSLAIFDHASRKCAVIHSITLAFLNEQIWFGYIKKVFSFLYPLDESLGYIGILMSVRPSVCHTFGFRIIIKVPLSQIFSNFHTLHAVYHKIQVKFDYGLFHIYHSWVMALFLLENRDFLGFRMIFKIYLNQIFSNFSTML